MHYNKKILICGLPGSGKSTLAKPLSKLLDAVLLNADHTREKYDDWDFSSEGRIRQADRMRHLADGVTKAGKIAIADFICPTEETRERFGADYTIWMNTIEAGRYDDTNEMFEMVTTCDFEVTKWGHHTAIEIKKIIEKETDNDREIVWKENNYVDGKKDGKWITHNFEGEIDTAVYYENDKIIGETRYYYYLSGKLKNKSDYKNNKLNGKTIEWYESGLKCVEKNYKDDMLDGQLINYRDYTGYKLSEFTYKNNELNGEYTRYFNNSTEKAMTGFYKDGVLDGKSSEYQANEIESEKKAIETHETNIDPLKKISKFSAFSGLKLDTKGDYCPIDIDPRFDDGTKEVWESYYPTRTDVSNIENETDIVSIFGDSFIYGAGLPRRYELGTLLRKEYPDVLFANFGKPGASNNRIVTAIEQWTNDEHSKKTKTIIVGLSSIYRFDYYIDSEYPESIDAMNSIHDDSDRKMRSYDISSNWQLERQIKSERDKETRKKLKKSLKNAQDGILLSQVTYANVFFKNFETIIRRIDWITKQRKWNVIFVRNLSWDESIHEEDTKVIDQYFKDMNIKERQCKVIGMKEPAPYSNVINSLDCGHWGPETMNNLVQEIKKAYDVL